MRILVSGAAAACSRSDVAVVVELDDIAEILRQQVWNAERDVVVAESPVGLELFIKRIAGCPGDTVEIHPDGTIWVNGKHFEYGEGNALTPQAFPYGHGYMD